MQNIPLSLYVHFPWCVKKCPYCDFNSHELGTSLPGAQYIDALCKDLENELQRIPDRKRLQSIFLGGGTPSLFPASEIKQLLGNINTRLDVTEAEITIEANPGTFDASNFSGYRQAGINRISLGAQSFSVEHLQSLGRIHSPGEVVKAFKGARQAGFSRINIDLMFGLPGQTLESAMHDLECALDLGPEHISWYQLTIEQNTYFHRYPPELPDDDLLAAMTDAGHCLLASHGYKQYEVSAFSKPGEESSHNLNYWQFGDYLGIGAGAHGKISSAQGIERTTKTRVPADYLGFPRRNCHQVPPEDLVLEFLLNALRLTTGFEISLFEERTGLAISELDEFLRQAASKEMLSVEGGQITPTLFGRRYLTDLLLLI